MEYVTLNNGVKMPVLGYGVYQVDPAECERCVLDAISVGYRSIDTAQAYGNEEGVGNAVVKCGVPREELFITTKVWISNAGYMIGILLQFANNNIVHSEMIETVILSAFLIVLISLLIKSKPVNENVSVSTGDEEVSGHSGTTILGLLLILLVVLMT